MSLDDPNTAPGSPAGDRSREEDPETAAAELRAALERAAKAPTLLVATDFDGALAEFTLDPDDTAPSPPDRTSPRRAGSTGSSALCWTT